MMNQQDIFRKIGSILTELNEQYQFLAQNPDKLNDLEVELFLANANFLSDHVHIVKKLNTIKEGKPLQHEVVPVDSDVSVEDLQPVLQSYDSEEECFDPVELAEVATAEEEEERVDIRQEQEVIDDEKIHQDTAEILLNKDFFKPDQDDHTFELVLDNSTNHEFDYQEKPVDEIFDRPLSKTEEEILAQKNKIHEIGEVPVNGEDPTKTDEDEIGPEPFLISHDENTTVEEAEMEQHTSESVEPVESLENVELDEPVISPVVDEHPSFIPDMVQVKPEEQPISEKPAPTLNDLLAKNNEQNELLKAPILDLKQSISLNEKLLFIKDLFNGYNLAYSEAIDIANKMTSFEAADSFLQKNYATQNNWTDKQSTVDQLYELLNRRFGK